jgi:hypothetical protein
MYKIPILKSANAIFFLKRNGSQSNRTEYKAQNRASKKQPSWHWLVEQAL